MKIGRKAAFNVWKFSRTLPDNSLDVNGRKSAQKVGRQGRVKLDALFVYKFMFLETLLHCPLQRVEEM